MQHVTVNRFVPTNDSARHMKFQAYLMHLKSNSWNWTLAGGKQRAVFTTERPGTVQGWDFRKHALSAGQCKFKVMP